MKFEDAKTREIVIRMTEKECSNFLLAFDHRADGTEKLSDTNILCDFYNDLSELLGEE